MSATVPIRRNILRSTARIIDREARALAEAYRVPGSLRWECIVAKREHDKYRKLATELRTHAAQEH